MWECPICNREFRTRNQSHTCDLVNIALHFKADGDGSLKYLFDFLCDCISDYGNFKCEAVKTSIAIKGKSTFLSVKIKPNSLEILFFLDHKHDVFPIVPTVQISKNKIIHLVSVNSEEEIKSILPILQLSFDTYFT